MSAVVVLFDPIRVAPRGQEAADASSIAPFGGGKQAGARGRGGCHRGRVLSSVAQDPDGRRERAQH